MTLILASSFGRSDLSAVDIGKQGCVLGLYCNTAIAQFGIKE